MRRSHRKTPSLLVLASAPTKTKSTSHALSDVLTHAREAHAHTRSILLTSEERLVVVCVVFCRPVPPVWLPIRPQLKMPDIRTASSKSCRHNSYFTNSSDFLAFIPVFWTFCKKKKKRRLSLEPVLGAYMCRQNAYIRRKTNRAFCLILFLFFSFCK